ncbi:oryzin precursor [Hypoxylon sp. NC1633]|nr:oryzin precursor [Hypoxylon sp. NC1633]
MKFLGAVLLAAAAATPLGALAAPILAARGGEAIPGRWIAVLKPESEIEGTTSETFLGTVTHALGGVPPTHTYKIGGFHGYAIAASEEAIGSVADMAEIAYIEPDVKISVAQLTTQTAAPWGLARISHRTGGASEYRYDESAGQGTFAYIIDTGIFTAHPEFGGRASFGANFVQGEKGQGAGVAAAANDADENGHGTHVAGTVGSATYGVAKRTNLVAVKVLGADGSGPISQVIAGLQWAVDDATSKGRIGKAVANISLGALRILSSSVNSAAAAAVKAGLFLAVAAGNGNVDASQYAPASEPTVCTVGATRADDVRAYFSNYGDLIDIWAPGVDIMSTWKNGSTAIISGTSMATPHVTGLSAYLLALEGPRDPIALCQRIQKLATTGVVGNSMSNNNLLAYNGQA